MVFTPLEKNWDSYDGEPVTQATCDLANKMIDFMASIGLKHTTAGPDGALYFFDADERQVVRISAVDDDALTTTM